MAQQRPGWATGVGVIGIIWGACGILKGFGAMLLPFGMSFMHQALQTPAAKEGMDSAAAQSPAMVGDLLHNLQNAPSWVGWGMGAQGVLMILVGVMIVIWSIRMLQSNAASPGNLTMWLVTDIVSVVIRAALMAAWLGLLGGLGGLVGILPTLVVDLILIVILKTSGKGGFAVEGS